MKKITYEKFIQNILDKRGRFGCGNEYHEHHHIIPRCMGGNDDEENIIDLFAKEHFEAHRLLALEYPDNDKLQYAWGMMSHIGRFEVSPEEYEEAREACRKAFSETRKGWYTGENNPNYGNHWTEEQKSRAREAKKNISKETREKMSISQKQRFKDPNVIAFYRDIMNERFLIQKNATPIHHMVTLEYMDDYINDIQHRVLHGRLPLEDMRIVERYKEFRQHENVFKEVDFKKLMRQLTKSLIL